jgi:predicted ATPase/class 3 adenylate cyclase
MVGGMVTLLFTDIQGSTQMLDRLGPRYRELLREHHRVMREAIVASGGREVGTAGDSFFAVFSRAADAVGCAERAQRGLADAPWPDGGAPSVRMGIHTGTPDIADGDFVGIDVHRAARVMSVAYGGQVLLTEEARGMLDSPAELRDLGYHRLKDLPAPEHLFQLIAPGLETEFPRLRSLNRSNLPTPANPLVGRRLEVERGLELLSRREVRSVTLVGAGGAGKTRLAIELAGEAVRAYRDGVWFVRLAPIIDPALVVAEVARVLEVEPVSGELVEQALVAALAERELLLVLDNFEHLLDAAGAIGELLASVPSVDVLSTSRTPLRISGEYRIGVPPLPMVDAVELFVQRASAVRPTLSMDENGEAIERICARLDGLPLALELAAARVAVFHPRALDDRLAQRLMLPEGPRDLPERQRTLTATIDWSYRLLEPADRVLMQSLAPFIGGVRCDAAESIWGVDATERLFSLAEMSLLRSSEDPDRETRFSMLETVRGFALERLAADGRATDAAERHAEHFFALTEHAAPHLVGREQRHWVERLERDHSNLRAAIDHLIEHEPERAVQMAGNLEWFWVVRGYAAEGGTRLAKALESVPAHSPSRGRALAAAGQIALHAGRPVEALPLLLQALELAREEGDDRGRVLALTHLGWAYEATGDRVKASVSHQEAVAIAQAADDAWTLGLALNNYAIMIARAGEVDRARTLLDESLLLARQTGEPRAIALAANNLTQIALDAGDLEQADALNTEALAQARAIESRPMIATALETEALIALLRGDVDDATSQLRAAVEAMRLALDVEAAASLLCVAGTLAAIRHEPLRAARLWSAGDHHRARVGLRETPTIEGLQAEWQPRARAAAPDEASWDAAWAAGARISLDDALALAST